MNKFTIASVAVATALLAGCGGSSSSDGGKGDELPSGGEAQACFNPELWKMRHTRLNGKRNGMRTIRTFILVMNATLLKMALILTTTNILLKF